MFIFIPETSKGHGRDGPAHFLRLFQGRLKRRAARPPFQRSTIAVTAPRRRRTFSRVREGTLTMGLFGLGGPEIAVIAVVAGLVLGPEKLSGLARDFGKVAGELKDVPKEFQEGLSEGDAANQAQKELVAASDKPQSETETESAPTAIEENA